MKAFDKLHKDIQRVIWDLGWEAFRKIQSDAINELIENPRDMIISAPTSSGKTEAAFIPVLSIEREKLSSGLKILYISPLKALINDQFSRINELCRKMDIKITKWHGDANQSQKKNLIKNPSGILLITPESLESLLINREPEARKMFKDLSFIIIDEVHAFAGEPRGDQLRSLINRIQELNQIACYKIALSATIGSLEIIAHWLSTENVIEIVDQESGKGIRGSIRIYDDKDLNTSLGKALLKQTQKGKNLFFANSKRKLEELCLLVKGISENPNLIDIHHGSLDKEQREIVEFNLKNNPMYSVFCTNTLELGIDIGDIDEITLLSPPWSVSSLIQKIGRSGRKEGKDISFNFSLKKINPPKDSHIIDHVNWSLVRSIALVELLRQGWCEDGDFLTAGYSTTVHQIMAIIAQKRSISPQQIYEKIIKRSFKEKISKDEFKEMLNFLGENDFIVQNKMGEINLGLAGDKLTENYDFLSVFQTPEEWLIVSNSTKIGNIPISNMFNIGDNLILGGKLWKVHSIDFDTKRISVRSSTGGKVPLFEGASGSIHPKVHQLMKHILESENDFSYLYSEAREELSYSRRMYKHLLEEPTFLPIFNGTKVTNTICATLKSIDSDIINYDFGLLSTINIKEHIILLNDFENIINREIFNNEEELSKLLLEKYDYLLPSDIKKKALIQHFFDFKNTKEWLSMTHSYRDSK